MKRLIRFGLGYYMLGSHEERFGIGGKFTDLVNSSKSIVGWVINGRDYDQVFI